MKLYEIPSAYQAWMRKIEDNDGEISQELDAELEAIDCAFSKKVDAYAALIIQAKHEEKAMREEVHRMEEKARSLANLQKRLKQMLMQGMKSMDTEKVKGHRFRVQLMHAQMPTIHWVSSDPIPEPFQKNTVSLDYDAALKSYRDIGSLPQGFDVKIVEYVLIQ